MSGLIEDNWEDVICFGEDELGSRDSDRVANVGEQY